MSLEFATHGQLEIVMSGAVTTPTMIHTQYGIATLGYIKTPIF